MRQHLAFDVRGKHAFQRMGERRAWRDAVDADPTRAQVEGDVTDQVVGRGLGGAVGGHVLVAVLAGHRGDRQHRTAAGPLHMRSRQLRQAEQREHVQFVGPAEIGHRHVEGLRAAATGVADEQRKTPEVGHAALDQLLKLSLVGDIAGVGTGLATGSDDFITHPFGGS